ncbi:hypothetical protein J5N97_006440 [Dioscorea zingiberensis]|uniref:Uncharacterized protein n=1 Tax=Dioscorea zingiberensis TaxID=325984 RepID=A0A9D5HTB8_9LILI|nr:hypothetical protein J5N97_006440 [Dioscorea zingiberensis]
MAARGCGPIAPESPLRSSASLRVTAAQRGKTLPRGAVAQDAYAVAPRPGAVLGVTDLFITTPAFAASGRVGPNPERRDCRLRYHCHVNPPPKKYKLVLGFAVSSVAMRKVIHETKMVSSTQIITVLFSMLLLLFFTSLSVISQPITVHSPLIRAPPLGMVQIDWKDQLPRSPIEECPPIIPLRSTQCLFITTPAFAASVEVPIVVDPRRPLDPRRPVCNRPRGLPCTTPINPPPKKYKLVLGFAVSSVAMRKVIHETKMVSSTRIITVLFSILLLLFFTSSSVISQPITVHSPLIRAPPLGMVQIDWKDQLPRSPIEECPPIIPLRSTQCLFITTPAFAASVEVPIVVDPRRPLDPTRPVCNRPRGLPCIAPPPKKCKYYSKCPSGPPATKTDAAVPNINENN